MGEEGEREPEEEGGRRHNKKGRGGEGGERRREDKGAGGRRKEGRGGRRRGE